MANDARNNLAVIVKPVGSRCNMRCAYCYYLDKAQFSSHKKQNVMSFELLEELIRQTIEAAPGPVVSFTWHGGEPTLAGIEFFARAVALQRKYLPRGKQVWNSLQTNGLKLDDQWCAFLRENRFDVGLSIDGDAATHDKNRRDAGGKPTWDRVVKTVRRLQAAGIQPDLLCTVTADTVQRPLEVYRALRALDTGWIQFIPVVVCGENGVVDPVSVTPQGYGDFLCTVFDEWVMHDLGRLDVQLFAETAKVWAGGAAGVCYMAPVCGRVLVAEEDGAVYACDHFVDAEHRLGNIMTHTIKDLAADAQQAAFGNAKRDALTQQCRVCPYLPCCGGGCLKDRFAAAENGEEGQYYLCGGLQHFFAHAYEPLHTAMRLSRQRTSPTDIMQALRAAAQTAE